MLKGGAKLDARLFATEEAGLKEDRQMMRLVMAILWPSFLVAIVEEGFFFSFFDPNDLAMIYGHMDLSPKAAYTIGFFCFWLFSSLASMLTYYLAYVPNDRNPPL